MRLLLSMFSIGLLALGASLIFDPGAIGDRAVHAWRAYAAPPTPAPQGPPGAPGVRIQLTDAGRLGDFQPVGTWSLDCARGSEPLGRSRAFASR